MKLPRIDWQRNRLIADGSLIGTVVEESLRFAAPIQIITRLAKEEVVIKEQKITPELEESVRDAVIMCPMQAIKLLI